MKNLKLKMRWRLISLLGLVCVLSALLWEVGHERGPWDSQRGAPVSGASKGLFGSGDTSWADIGDRRGDSGRDEVRNLSVYAAGSVSGQPLRFSGVAGKGRLKGRVLPVHIPPLAQFKGLKEGMKISMPSFDGEVLEGTLNYVQTRPDGVVWLAGDLVGREGTFFWKRSAREYSGMALLPGTEMAIELKRDGDRTVMMEKQLGLVLCRRYPGFKQVSGQTGSVISPPVGASSGGIPLLYSVSGEVLETGGDAVKGRPVLYLDFDGEVVQHPRWNGGKTIVAARPNLIESDVRQIVSEVAADFSPFNVVVTTDVALLVESRKAGFNTMRCIVTPTSDAAPGAGGVALLNSFETDPAETDPLGVPCWAFNGTDRLSGIDSCAMTISHELGHTFGLQHDGDLSPFQEYNSGFGAGAFSWGPIMGAPFGKRIVQWSMGEYAGANNQEDDVDIIQSNPAMALGGGRLGFQADEVDGSPLSSTGGLVNQIGVIAWDSDVDVYRMDLKEGVLDISASPVGVNPNVDLRIELLDAVDSVLAVSNPSDALDASLSYAVTASMLVGGKVTLKLRLSSVGRGNPASGGYSKYGSIGAYRLVGSVPALDSARPEIMDSASWGKVDWALDGGVCSWTLKDVRNSPAEFTLIAVSGYESLPPGCVFDSKKGEIRGIPKASGMFRSRISARNSAGVSSAFDVEIVVRRKMLSSSTLVWVGGVPSAYQADFGAISPTNLPLAYSISPTLPAGLSFDTSTGVLSGTIEGGTVYSGVIQSSGSNGFYAGGALRLEGVSGGSVLDDGEGKLSGVTARGWRVDASERVTGAYSMVSDVTGHGESSWMRAETRESGWVTFSWKVDSDRAGDFLSFIVNGRKVTSISGNRPWQEVSYYLPSPTGGGATSNTLEWVYEKDGSEQSGRDCGWVDEVRFGDRVSILSHPKSQRVSEGALVKLTCSVTGVGARFDWFQDERLIGTTSERQIASGPTGNGMSQSVLTLSKTLLSDSGLYWVRVTPEKGRALVSEKARLEVSGLPRMVKAVQAATAVAGVGSVASFSTTYTRGDELLYQWSVGGVRVPGAVRPPCFNATTKVEVINTVTGSTLRISGLSALKGAPVTYPVRLEVRSKAGGAPSYQDARLTVRPQ